VLVPLQIQKQLKDEQKKCASAQESQVDSEELTKLKHALEVSPSLH